MRYSRVLQCIHKEKKRLIQSIRHIGYWKRRDSSNPIDIKKQYVSKGQKNKQFRYPSRAFKIQVANLCNWLVQKAQWKIRLQRVWVLTTPIYGSRRKWFIMKISQISPVKDALNGCFEALAKCLMQAHFSKGENSEHPLRVFCFLWSHSWRYQAPKSVARKKR